MTDQLTRQNQQTGMELVTPEAMNQIARQFQDQTKQSLAKMQAAGLMTITTQDFLVASGTMTAIKQVNFIQQSNTLMQIAAQSGHLTQDLQDALISTRAITLQALAATHGQVSTAALAAFNRDLEELFSKPLEQDSIWKRLFGG